MNKRQEDFFNEATKQIRDSYVFQSEGTYSDDDVRDIATLLAEYGYQYAVEKTCEFLKKYAANFVALPDEGQQPIGDTNAIYGTKSLLYYLRKEMEE